MALEWLPYLGLICVGLLGAGLYFYFNTPKKSSLISTRHKPLMRGLAYWIFLGKEGMGYNSPVKEGMSYIHGKIDVLLEDGTKLTNIDVKTEIEIPMHTSVALGEKYPVFCCVDKDNHPHEWHPYKEQRIDLLTETFKEKAKQQAKKEVMEGVEYSEKFIGREKTAGMVPQKMTADEFYGSEKGE